MATATRKRSVITLFSGESDLYSHQARIVIAEKGINAEITIVDKDNLPPELEEFNPYNTVPTLVDRDLVLYHSRVVMEYLDERFPHPPLMPVYPIQRAETRLMMHRVDSNWYPLVNIIMTGETKDADAARTKLRDEILTIAPVFDHFEYFMSDAFSLSDCYMGPLLWRLPELGIELGSKNVSGINSYMLRVFERESFQLSLTETEQEIRVNQRVAS